MHVICLNFKEVLPVHVNLYLALGLDIVISKLSTLARWQSGDAADCKSVYAGSIPARASIIPLIFYFFKCGSARHFFACIKKRPVKTGRLNFIQKVE